MFDTKFRLPIIIVDYIDYFTNTTIFLLIPMLDKIVDTLFNLQTHYFIADFFGGFTGFLQHSKMIACYS